MEARFGSRPTGRQPPAGPLRSVNAGLLNGLCRIGFVLQFSLFRRRRRALPGPCHAGSAPRPGAPAGVAAVGRDLSLAGHDGSFPSVNEPTIGAPAAAAMHRTMVRGDPPPSDWSILRFGNEEDQRWQGSATSRRRSSACCGRRRFCTARAGHGSSSERRPVPAVPPRLEWRRSRRRAGLQGRLRCSLGVATSLSNAPMSMPRSVLGDRPGRSALGDRPWEIGLP